MESYFEVPASLKDLVDMLNSCLWSVLVIRKYNDAIYSYGDKWTLDLPRYSHSNIAEFLEDGIIIVIDGELKIFSSNEEEEVSAFLHGAFYAAFRGKTIGEINNALARMANAPFAEREAIIKRLGSQ